MSAKLCQGTVKVFRFLDPKERKLFRKGLLKLRPIRLKCPDCKKRMMSAMNVEEEGLFVMYYIPSGHKPKFWWKPKKRKKKR